MAEAVAVPLNRFFNVTKPFEVPNDPAPPRSFPHYFKDRKGDVVQISYKRGLTKPDLVRQLMKIGLYDSQLKLNRLQGMRKVELERMFFPMYQDYERAMGELTTSTAVMG